MNLLPLIFAISALAQMPNGAFLRSSMNCTLDGVKVKNGNSTTGYLSKLPTGPCSSQTRVCKNAVLSGTSTYQYSSCTAGCAGTYWGDVTAGTSYTRYSTNRASVGSTCANYAQTYTCSGGSMGYPLFPYTNATCENPCAPQTVEWTVGGITCSYDVTTGGQSGDSATLNDSVGPATGSVTATCTNGSVVLTNPSCASATCAGGGTKVGGYCWYLAATNTSCSATCSSKGGYHAATKDYAGSAGTENNCKSVLTALGLGAQIAGSKWVGASACAGLGLGCSYWPSSGGKWCNGTTTNSTDVYGSGQRACACNN